MGFGKHVATSHQAANEIFFPFFIYCCRLNVLLPEVAYPCKKCQAYIPAFNTLRCVWLLQFTHLYQMFPFISLSFISALYRGPSSSTDKSDIMHYWHFNTVTINCFLNKSFHYYIKWFTNWMVRPKIYYLFSFFYWWDSNGFQFSNSARLSLWLKTNPNFLDQFGNLPVTSGVR